MQASYTGKSTTEFQIKVSCHNNNDNSVESIVGMQVTPKSVIVSLSLEKVSRQRETIWQRDKGWQQRHKIQKGL